MKNRVVAEFVAGGRDPAPGRALHEKPTLEMRVKTAAKAVEFEQRGDTLEVTGQRVVVAERHDAPAPTGHTLKKGIGNHGG
jgi:hypothetical protein